MADQVIWKPNKQLLKKLQDMQVSALAHTAEALHEEVVQAQVVPRMDGKLQGKGFFIDYSGAAGGEVSLVHSTPYARRLYFHPEYHFHQERWTETVEHEDGSVSVLTHDGNPHAKGRWFEDWLPGGSRQDHARKIYQYLYKGLTGL